MKNDKFTENDYADGPNDRPAAVSGRMAWRRTRLGYGVHIFHVDELWNVLVFQ
jgi:hypothetical protein